MADNRFTDEELLGSVVPHLQQFVDRGDAARAWAMGATWAGRRLLMADVLASIRRCREDAGDDPPTDEELADRIASGLRYDGMVMGLEVRCHDREQAEFRQRVHDQHEREAAERAADPAKQAAWEEEQAELARTIADIQAKAERGELKDDSGWIRERLRGLRANGAGHRMAMTALEAEEEERLRRLRLVRTWLEERVDPADSPPWAAQAFEEAEDG